MAQLENQWDNSDPAGQKEKQKMKMKVFVAMAVVMSFGFATVAFAQDPAPAPPEQAALAPLEPPVVDAQPAPTDAQPAPEEKPLPSEGDVLVAMFKPNVAADVLKAGELPKIFKGKKGQQELFLLLAAVSEVVGTLPQQELADLKAQLGSYAPANAQEIIALKLQMLEVRQKAASAYATEMGVVFDIVSNFEALKAANPSLYKRVMGEVERFVGIAASGSNAFANIQFGRRYRPTEVNQTQNQLQMQRGGSSLGVLGLGLGLVGNGGGIGGGGGHVDHVPSSGGCTSGTCR